MRVFAVAALSDNYVYVAVGDGSAAGRAVVVDPGEGAPVTDFLSQYRLQAEAVLITHLHADHTGGLAEVRRAFPAAVVYAPDGSGIKGAIGVGGGDAFSVFDGVETFRVMHTPGHTAEHISFFASDNDGGGSLFCGDVLFAGGCGRILGGTAAQMHQSLALLKTLPDKTLVYCGHEYTENNLRFALAAEPGNAALAARADSARKLRKEGKPTVPSTMSEEKATNPFLRLSEAEIINAATQKLARAPKDEAETFAVLRKWKDNF